MSSSIAKFYSGRSVFITGGLGFIGKQFVEKLLRSCPEVENIYILIRQKKGQTVEHRLKQTLTSPVFDRLRQQQPDFQRKLIPVVGDVTNDFLGISDQDHSRMASKVSIVVHSAATLNFQEPLRVAVNTNVLGLRRVLTVSKQLPKLDALLHVSTGYAHVDKGDATIEEKIYEPPLTPQKAISMIREMTDEQLAEVTPQLLKTHRRPNTYTLTKAIAEKLLDEERGNLSCCIIRPTIVTASYAEPFPGWVDNYTAANGVYAGYGTGFIRAVLTTKNGVPLDLIPVDMTANAIIAAAWHSNTYRKDSKDVPVYNLTNEGILITYAITKRMMENIHRDPFSSLPVRKPLFGMTYLTDSRLLYNYITKVYSPARFTLMDIALQLTGKKPRLMKMFETTNKLQGVLEYFTLNGFKWSNNNANSMFEAMNDVDKKEFDIQMSRINVEHYFSVWWRGIKKYVLKEKEAVETRPSTVPAKKTETFA